MPDMKNVKIAVMQWNKAEIINYKTVFIIAAEIKKKYSEGKNRKEIYIWM